MAKNKIVDHSLHFGMQNFMFIMDDTATGSGLDYDYVGYQNYYGVVLIVRYPKDEKSEAGYYIEVGEFATLFADRADYDYVLPKDLKCPKLEVKE
jgi:hypothetical protein